MTQRPPDDPADSSGDDVASYRQPYDLSEEPAEPRQPDASPNPYPSLHRSAYPPQASAPAQPLPQWAYGMSPPQHAPADWGLGYAHHYGPQLKHTGVGIASLVIAGLSGLAIFVVFVVAGVMEASTPGGIDEDSPEAIVVGFALIGAVLLAMIGLALGVVGCVLPNRKRLLGILGLCINGVIVLGTCALIAIGLSMP